MLDRRWKLWVFGGDCVYMRLRVCVHVVKCMFLHPHMCVCVREEEVEAVTVLYRCIRIVARFHILMTLSFYWTINGWRSRESTLLQHWSLTDQSSTPSITLILATSGCLLNALYDVVSLALDEECRVLYCDKCRLKPAAHLHTALVSDSKHC